MYIKFIAVEYHKEFLPYEKSFLDLAEGTSRLQVFLKFNYQTQVIPSHFVLRARPLILWMQIVESDSCIGFLFGAISEKIRIQVSSRNSLPVESFQEKFDSIPETFTSSEE